MPGQGTHPHAGHMTFDSGRPAYPTVGFTVHCHDCPAEFCVPAGSPFWAGWRARLVGWEEEAGLWHCPAHAAKEVDIEQPS